MVKTGKAFRGDEPRPRAILQKRLLRKVLAKTSTPSEADTDAEETYAY